MLKTLGEIQLFAFLHFSNLQERLDCPSECHDPVGQDDGGGRVLRL